MRRSALHLSAALLAVTGLVGACSDSSDTATTESSVDGTTVASGDTTPAGDDTTTTLEGALPKPTVDLPENLPTELVVTTLTEGTGDGATDGALIVVQYVGVRSATGQEFDNSYDAGDPLTFTLGAGNVIKGWDQGLVGAKVGERRQLDIPADLAYGDTPLGDVIQPGDALSFVIDVVAILPGSTPEDEPTVEVTASANVPALTIEDLVVGAGAALEEGQQAAVHMVLYRADTGERLDGSWGTTPSTFTVSDDTEIYPIFVEAVRGMKVGGRRLVQMPFAEIFDGQGREQLGLPAEVDMIVVLDLVGAY